MTDQPLGIWHPSLSNSHHASLGSRYRRYPSRRVHFTVGATQVTVTYRAGKTRPKPEYALTGVSARS